MKFDLFIEITLIQIVVITFLCIAIIYLFKQSRLNKYERRIESFSLFTNNDKGLSLFDKIYNILWKLINKISRSFEKLNLTPNYAKGYDKYISFEERNDKTGYTYIAIKFLIAIFISLLSLVTMIFQYLRFNISIFILIFTLGFLLPDLYLSIIYKRKKKIIEEDLLKAIIVMNNAFKSGSNITQAVGIVKDELDGPIRDEFKKIYIDINYGLSLEVVFNRFYERVKIEDAKYITSSLTLLNKTGGNIVNVFNLIEKTFFDKRKLKNELNSLTAASMFIYKLLLCMPFLLALVIIILNPSYFRPFFTSGIGLICFAILVILYSFYIFIINRIMKVKL